MGLVLHVLGTKTKASHVLGTYSLMSYIPNDLRADANTEKRPQPEKKEKWKDVNRLRQNLTPNEMGLLKSAMII